MHSIAWWPTLAVLFVATLTDLRDRRIPNWLVVPFLIAGLGVSVFANGAAGLGHSVLGLLVGGVATGVFYLLGGMGMGDVKLCAAVGVWVGPNQMALALVAIALAGGGLAILWAWSKGILADSLGSTGTLLAGFGKQGLRPHAEVNLKNAKAHSIPYAPAIALGTVFSFFMVGA